MTPTAWTAIFATVTVVIAFAWLTVWSRRDTSWRHVAVVAAILACPALAAAIVDVLGWHRNIYFDWRLSGDHTVLAHKAVRGKAVYLYIDTPASVEPHAVYLPWSEKTEKLLEELEAAQRKRPDGLAVMKFEHSWDQNPPQFHELPQPMLIIPKRAPDQGRRYERES